MDRDRSCEASVNSRNSPVSRNPTCSPMSTALSPTRSSARAAMFMCMPQSRLLGSSASSSAWRCMRRLSRRPGRPCSGAAGTAPGRGARTLPSPCGPSDDHDSPISSSCCAHRLAPGQIRGRQVDLRHVHRLVADPLEVQVGVQDRRHQPKVGRDRRLQRQAAPGSPDRSPGIARRSRRPRRSPAWPWSSSRWTSASHGCWTALARELAHRRATRSSIPLQLSWNCVRCIIRTAP